MSTRQGADTTQWPAPPIGTSGFLQPPPLGPGRDDTRLLDRLESMDLVWNSRHAKDPLLGGLRQLRQFLLNAAAVLVDQLSPQVPLSRVTERKVPQKPNLPFPFFQSARAGIVSMVSQCSTIFPASTRNRS